MDAVAFVKNIGIDKAQEVLANAPDGALHGIYAKPSPTNPQTLIETFEYSKTEGDERWHWNKVHGWFKSQMTLEQAARATSRHSCVVLSELEETLKTNSFEELTSKDELSSVKPLYH